LLIGIRTHTDAPSTVGASVMCAPRLLQAIAADQARYLAH